jgi:ABC-type sugar transport system substrate-binding protein
VLIAGLAALAGGGCASILAPVPASRKHLLHLGISIADGTDPFQRATEQALAARARQVSLDLLPTADARGQEEQQARQILTLVRRGAQALLVVPAPGREVTAAIARAEAEHVQVVVVDQPAPVRVAAVVRPGNAAIAAATCAALSGRVTAAARVLDIVPEPASPGAAELHRFLATCLARIPVAALTLRGTADGLAAAVQASLRGRRPIGGVVIEDDVHVGATVLSALRTDGAARAARHRRHPFTVSIGGAPAGLAALGARSTDLVLSPDLALLARAAVAHAFLAVLHRAARRAARARDAYGDPVLLIRAQPVRAGHEADAGLWGDAAPAS